MSKWYMIPLIAIGSIAVPPTLGERVTGLEQKIARLTRRVSSLERAVRAYQGTEYGLNDMDTDIYEEIVRLKKKLSECEGVKDD